MKRFGKVLLWLGGTVVGLALALFVAMEVSPWPRVIVIRWLFDQDAKSTAEALVKHLPSGVIARPDLVYDAASPNGKLDVYYPASAAGQKVTTVVWVHGGGYVSGRKEDIGNYARVLAGQGFVVVSVDYTIAPEAQYPTPIRQVNAALAWLAKNEAGLPVDAARFVLAGDSAGSGIVAQLANVISAPAYARDLGIQPALPRQHLVGVILHCGVYGIDGIDFDGGFGGFLKTALWSYFGRKDALSDPRLDQFSVMRHVTSDFPPAFISAGNADPLLPQSQAMAAALKAKGVRVDELFFPPQHVPALGHEYQFNLDTAEGRQALERSVRFLQSL